MNILKNSILILVTLTCFSTFYEEEKRGICATQDNGCYFVSYEFSNMQEGKVELTKTDILSVVGNKFKLKNGLSIHGDNVQKVVTTEPCKKGY